MRDAVIGDGYASESLEQYLRPLSQPEGHIVGDLPPGLFYGNYEIQGIPRAPGTFLFKYEADPPGGGAVRDLMLQVKPSVGVTTYSISNTAANTVASTGVGDSISVAYGLMLPEPVRGQSTINHMVPSGAAFIQYGHDGTLVSETTVPAVEALSDFTIPVELTATVKTGVAVANTTGLDRTVDVTFIDSSGVTVKTATLKVAAASQVSAFLDEPPFNGPPGFIGSARFRASLAMGFTALRGLTNERSDFLLTTLPLIKNEIRNEP